MSNCANCEKKLVGAKSICTSCGARRDGELAEHRVLVTLHFDEEYLVQARSYEEARNKALELALEWEPHSKARGENGEWYRVAVESVWTDDSR